MKDKRYMADLFSDMIQKLEERINLKAFIIFGSRARGNALPYSDYDIVIIADFEEKYIYRSEWIVQIAPEVPLDVFCYTSDEFDALFNQFNLTAIDAIDKGIFLKGNAFLEKYVSRLLTFKEKGLKKEGNVLIPPSL